MKNLILLCLILLCTLEITAGRIQRTEHTATQDLTPTNSSETILHTWITHVDDWAKTHSSYRPRTAAESSDAYKNYQACFSYNDTTIYYCDTLTDCIEQIICFLHGYNGHPCLKDLARKMYWDWL